MPYRFTRQLRIRLAPAAFGLAAGLAACGGADSPTALGVLPDTASTITVAVSPTEATVPVGARLKLIAQSHDSTGRAVGGPTTWTSSDPTIATVDTSGTVTTLSTGIVFMQAGRGRGHGRSKITVTTVTPSSVSVSPSSATILAGTTLQLSAEVLDSTGTPMSGSTVTWATSNSAVASVSSSGLVTAFAGGTATITATSGGLTGTSSIAVTTPTVSVLLSPQALALSVGASGTVTASVLDGAGNVIDQAVTWKSSNPSVAGVSGSGTSATVSGIAAGSALISATSDGITTSETVTVASSAPAPAPVASVAVSPASASLTVGQSLALAAITSDSAGQVLTGRSVTWATSNAAVATVSSAGTVTALAAGGVTITATSEGQSGTAAITVAATAPSGSAPTILDATFESDWSGMTNYTTVSSPTGVTRDGTRGYNGSWSAMRTLPVTSGSDVSAQFTYPFYAVGPATTYDRVFSRFAFYLDAPINGILKFNIFEGAGFGTQFGGLYFENGNLAWDFAQEAGAQFFDLQSVNGLVGKWHVVEVDYWRNGDPSGYPSVAIWLDGVALTGGMRTPAPGYWSNGRLYAGERRSSDRIGTANFMTVLNGTPANSVSAHLWLDAVGLSTNRMGMP